LPGVIKEISKVSRDADHLDHGKGRSLVSVLSMLRLQYRSGQTDAPGVHYWTTACHHLRAQASLHDRPAAAITRWEHEHVLEAVQSR
jgi:hypothetical protein